MLSMFIFVKNACRNSHALIEILIEICRYYDDEIKDLMLCGIYIEYRVLFD